MNKKRVAFTLGIMCILLTIAIVVQYQTVKNAKNILGTDSVNGELKAEVLTWKEKYDDIQKELAKAEKKLEKERETATKKNTNSSEAERNLKMLNAVIGTTDVTGKGIIITIADNEKVTNDSISALDNISDYLIHDTDLLILVNELKNAGAEAISINDQRITNMTSITCDGNVILVNEQKISSPFIVEAIGSQEALLGAIRRPGGFLEELEKYGLVSGIKKQNKITIHKYEGMISYQYVKK